MKIFGVLGMLDTRTLDGRTVSSECVNVRGYRKLPIMVRGGDPGGPEFGTAVGTLDRYWAEGDTLYYEATLFPGVVPEQDLRDGAYSLGMDITGDAIFQGGGVEFTDWEMRAATLVRPAAPTWPECSINVAE